MKRLWLAVALLALVYLAVWAVGRDGTNLDRPAEVGGSPVSLPSGQSDSITALALQDAQGKSAGASVELAGAPTPAYFTGPELTKVAPLSKNAQLGAVVVVNTKVNGNTVSRSTYHVVLPTQVVLVKQETP